MSDHTYAPRYHTFSPDVSPEARSEAKAQAADAGAEPSAPSGRLLTWSVLTICLGLWTVVGFLLWAPLLLSAMVRFSLALGRSMLSGAEPVEAGELLRNTASFYRRGFTVAIDAVFGATDGEDRKEKKGESRRTARVSRHVFFEILWAFVFWYLVLYVAGAVEASPVDGWRELVSVHWTSVASDTWGAFSEWSAGLLRF